jgi:hypothetical protein
VFVGFESTEQSQESGVFRRSLSRLCQEEVLRGGFFLQRLCCQGKIYCGVSMSLCCILIVSLIQGRTISTPATNGTILEGITRKSVMEIASDQGYQVTQIRLNHSKHPKTKLS